MLTCGFIPDINHIHATTAAKLFHRKGTWKSIDGFTRVKNHLCANSVVSVLITIQFKPHSNVKYYSPTIWRIVSLWLICILILGAAYARRSEMVLHTRIAHTGERPFQCAYCPKNFQRRDLMRKHERIHTDTRPYACQYCAKGKLSNNLIRLFLLYYYNWSLFKTFCPFFFSIYSTR